MLIAAEGENMNGWIMLKTMFDALIFHMQDIIKQWKTLLELERKTVSASLPELGWEFFNSLRTI